MRPTDRYLTDDDLKHLQEQAGELADVQSLLGLRLQLAIEEVVHWRRWYLHRGPVTGAVALAAAAAGIVVGVVAAQHFIICN